MLLAGRTAFDSQRSLLLARAAGAAYLDNPEEIQCRLGAEQLRPFRFGSGAGFTARINGEVLLSFRGTVPSLLANWLTNLDLSQIQERGRRIHCGISEAIDALWKHVEDSLNEIGGLSEGLWITGHSLGGAMALLAGERLIKVTPVKGVYTFGAPRVLCPAGSISYPVPLHRIEHFNDVVCHLPPSRRVLDGFRPALDCLLPESCSWFLPPDVDYCHAGTLTHLHTDGSIDVEVEEGEDEDRATAHFRRVATSVFGRGITSLLQDHAIERYITFLEANQSAEIQAMDGVESKRQPRTAQAVQNAFKAMALHEFLMEPRLAEEFKAAKFISWAVQRTKRPLAKVIAAKCGIPHILVENALAFISGERFAALPVRVWSDWLAWFKSPDDNYRSCCRSALCYIITGSHHWAFGALRGAASKHDDWARHHQLYGLIHGIDGNYERCLFELQKACSAEPYEDVRSRINQAIALGHAALAIPREAPANKVLVNEVLTRLPEVIGILYQAIASS